MSFRLTNFSYIIIGLGLLIAFFSKRRTPANMGWALTGLGIMFAGLNILNLGVPYIKENDNIMTLQSLRTESPHSLLTGMVTTMLVQSSSATVGLTIVLFNTGLISFESALGLTLGDNIGTCITAQLSSIGTSISAKRTAWAHTLYNVIGTIIAFIFLSLLLL